MVRDGPDLAHMEALLARTALGDPALEALLFLPPQQPARLHGPWPPARSAAEEVMS